ncbi:g3424 [Coccomyxa viridis]|uniref:fructose-bisphosphatase n=1 Tax=Coccomyxa viridis TaxID=1274662 RepID=A0ABP1FQ28_9CHLO
MSMPGADHERFRAEHPLLARAIDAILASVRETAELLRQGDSSGQVGSVNSFGDKQLKIDVKADEIIFSNLRSCGAVVTASSEERPDELDLGGQGFSVAFDPLDGSSIVDANFAVGAIFGIWRGAGLLHKTGAEQAAAAYAVYGPRTSVVLARPGRDGKLKVEELMLTEQGWLVCREDVRLGEKKVFAPANLRAAADNKAYADFVSACISEKYTLRYTGGFVPDVHHILTKGGGLFLNPTSSGAPAKLRLLYECAPIAFIVEAAGGASSNGAESVLKMKFDHLDRRTAITLGSREEVARSKHCLRA